MGCGGSKPATKPAAEGPDDGSKPQQKAEAKKEEESRKRRQEAANNADGQEGVVPCNAQPENFTGGEITNFGGSAPIAVTDLTRTSPPKFARVAIEHPPPTAQPVPEYEGAPHPKNEEERQDYLCALNVLDTPADSRFDDITKLLCTIFKVPIAIVSLVDKERQWFKSIQGLDVMQTDRRSSFCAWTLLPLHPEVLIVPDALLDERFRDNPLVTRAPFIRFYAGAPLVTADARIRLGSLCVIDLKPREFDAESCMVLANFAEVVVREIEKEKLRLVESARIRSQTNGLLRAMDHFSEGIMLVNMGTPQWDITFVNDAWSQLTGIHKDNSVGRSMWEIFHLQMQPTKEAFFSELKKQAEARTPFAEELALQSISSHGKETFLCNFRPASNATLDTRMADVGIPTAATWTPGTEDYYFVTLQRMTLSQSLDRSQSTHGASSSWRNRNSDQKREPYDDVELGPLIGQGAFGKVYRGIWNGAPVAVKIIQHPTDAIDPNAIGSDASGVGQDGEHFHSGTMRGALELMHSIDLGHPNIVQTYKSSQRPMQMSEAIDASILREAQGRSYTETWLVLEFCDKGNLQEAVDHGEFMNRTYVNGVPHNQPNMAAIKHTAREIASAMVYLHKDNILHGDLSGGNVLLVSCGSAPQKEGLEADTRGFFAKVGDFGLSRILTAEAISTGTYGTVTHMPPELLTTGKLSKATDVYAFGVLLWEMYTGKRPWAGMMQMQVIFHVTIQNKRLEFPEGTPPEFKKLATSCMAIDGKDRPTFAQILDYLAKMPLGEP